MIVKQRLFVGFV